MANENEDAGRSHAGITSDLERRSKGQEGGVEESGVTIRGTTAKKEDPEQKELKMRRKSKEEKRKKRYPEG